MSMKFLDRLEDIVNKCVNEDLGEWTAEGTIFHIYNTVLFEKLIKPYHLSTLKRQLHYYDFTIVHSFRDGLRFKHPRFLKHQNGIIEKDGVQRIAPKKNPQITIPMPIPKSIGKRKSKRIRKLNEVSVSEVSVSEVSVSEVSVSEVDDSIIDSMIDDSMISRNLSFLEHRSEVLNKEINFLKKEIQQIQQILIQTEYISRHKESKVSLLPPEYSTFNTTINANYISPLASPIGSPIPFQEIIEKTEFELISLR